MSELNIRVFKAVSLEVYAQLMKERADHQASQSVSDLYGTNRITSNSSNNNNTNSIQMGGMENSKPQIHYETPQNEGQLASEDEMSSHVDNEHNSIFTILPLFTKNDKNMANNLITLLKYKGLSWNSIGEVVSNGKIIIGSNVVDLITAAVRPGKLRKLILPGLHEFCLFIKDNHTPMHMLGNGFCKLLNTAKTQQIGGFGKKEWTVYENSELKHD